MNKNDFPNRFSLIDDKLYRGDHPDQQHLINLQRLGIIYIINLQHKRLRISHPEKGICKQFGLTYYEFSGISIKSINKIVDLIFHADEKIYVHCKDGRHYTSLIIASYLVKYKNKDPITAWNEDILNYSSDDLSEVYHIHGKIKHRFFDFCEYLTKHYV